MVNTLPVSELVPVEKPVEQVESLLPSIPTTEEPEPQPTPPVPEPKPVTSSIVDMREPGITTKSVAPEADDRTIEADKQEDEFRERVEQIHSIA